MNYLINHIISQLENIQNGKIWIGENFQKKLKLVTNKNAFLRPEIHMHSVAEIISHLTIWRKETILKIKTGEGSLTDDLEDNWFGNEQLIKLGWPHILNNFKTTSTKLIEILKQKEDSFLDEIYYDTDYKSRYKYLFVIEGMLHHDLYHLGQLGIVIKLLNDKDFN